MNAAIRRPADSDLGYFNARVRAMRGSLFRKPDYEPLMRLPSADALMERLKTSRYGPHIEAASSRHKAALDALSTAFMTELSSSLAMLWKSAPDGARPLLKAMYSHWEVFDLKILLRGIAREVRREEIKASLIPAGEFNAAALDALLSSKDIPDLINFLQTWGSPYAGVLKPGLAEYKRSGRIIEMELRADIVTNFLQVEALSSNCAGTRIMRGWLALKADFQNALTLFKIFGEGYSPAVANGFFMDGGVNLKRERFVRLAAMKEKEELLASLASIGGAAVRKALDLSGTDPVLMEEAAEDAMKERLKTLSIVDPLSIALAASFIYMKVREIKNLRLISRGLSFGVPLDELRLFIFYPV